MAQSVKCLTLAQVMVSQFVGSSPASGSVLTAQSLEPAWDSVSPSLSLSLSLSAPPQLVLSLLSLSLNNTSTEEKVGGRGACSPCLRVVVRARRVKESAISVFAFPNVISLSPVTQLCLIPKPVSFL